MKKIIALVAMLLLTVGIGTASATTTQAHKPAVAVTQQHRATLTLYSAAYWGAPTTWHVTGDLGPTYGDQFYIHMWYSGTNCPDTGAQEVLRLYQNFGGSWYWLQEWRLDGPSPADYTWATGVGGLGSGQSTNPYWDSSIPFRVHWYGYSPSCYYHVHIWKYA